MSFQLERLLGDRPVPLKTRLWLVESLISAILETDRFYGVEFNETRRRQAAKRACLAAGITYQSWLLRQSVGEHESD